MYRRICKLSQRIPYVGVEEGVLILKDGRAVVGYELKGLETESLDQAGYVALNETLATTLSSLPSGTVIQRMDCYYYEPYIGKIDAEVQGYFSLQASEHFYLRPVLRHKAYVLVSVGIPAQPKANPINSFFALGKTFYPNPLDGIDGRCYQASQLGNTLRTALAGKGIISNPLDEKAFQQLYLQYFNLEFGAIPQGINRQLTRHTHGMSLGEKEVRMVHLIGQGLQVAHHSIHNGIARPYSYPLTHQLAIPHVLSTSFRIEDTEKVLNQLDLQRKVNQSLGKLGNQATELQEEELAAFSEEIRRSHQAIVGLNLGVIIWDQDMQQVAYKIDRVVAGFGKLTGARAIVESLDTANLFFAQAPGNSWQHYRWLRMGAQQAAAYTHWMTPYCSEIGIQLCDRQGYPLEVNLFNTRLNNQNAIVVGPTGSGKSFTVGSCIIQRYERGDRQIIIDMGGTYHHTIQALGGNYIAYDPQTPLSLNPFFIQPTKGKYQIDGDQLILLITLISRIWKGEQGLSPAEQAALSRLIPLFYENYKDTSAPRLIDFVKWLEKARHQPHPQTEQLIHSLPIEELLLCLSPFTEGEYRGVLNAEWEIDLSEYPLICIDMARIKDHGMLYPIVSLLLTDLALRQIRSFPNQRKYLYMDEAWSMLSATMGRFVELMYRTIRKHNGAIYIITQGVGEIIHSGVGEAILANADTKILLPHSDPEAIQKVGSVLGLTRHELALFSSLRKFPKSRELLIKRGQRAKVFLLEASRAMSLALSSLPAERQVLNRLIEQKQGDIATAIAQQIEDEQ